VKAIVQGFGPMFQIYFTEHEAIHDYRDYCQFVDTAKYPASFIVCRPGIYMTPSNGLHWIISTAHTAKTWKRCWRRLNRVCAEFREATVFLGGGRITAACLRVCASRNMRRRWWCMIAIRISCAL